MECRGGSYHIFQKFYYPSFKRLKWSHNRKFWLRNGLKLIFWSLQAILLCIVGELAWGGLWLLALVTCARRQLTDDRSQVAGYTWHVTQNTWQLIPETFSSYFFWYFLVSVLLFAHIERFSAYCMRWFSLKTLMMICLSFIYPWQGMYTWTWGPTEESRSGSSSSRTSSRKQKYSKSFTGSLATSLTGRKAGVV